MIFLKHFDTTRQTLYGVGKTYVQRNAKVSDLNNFINEKMRWPAGTPLKLYEVNFRKLVSSASVLISFLEKKKEIKPGMIELMKPKTTFAQSEIQDGDVVCFQVEISEKETHDLEGQGLHANPLHYYDFLQNRVMIIFKPKFDEVDEHNPEFDITISKKNNYDHVSISTVIGLDYGPF